MQSTLDNSCPHENILDSDGKPFSTTKCIDCGADNIKPGLRSKVYSDMKKYNYEKKRLQQQ